VPYSYVQTLFSLPLPQQPCSWLLTCGCVTPWCPLGQKLWTYVKCAQNDTLKVFHGTRFLPVCQFFLITFAGKESLYICCCVTPWCPLGQKLWTYVKCAQNDTLTVFHGTRYLPVCQFFLITFARKECLYICGCVTTWCPLGQKLWTYVKCAQNDTLKVFHGTRYSPVCKLYSYYFCPTRVSIS